MYPSKVRAISAAPVANFLRYWLPVLVWMILIFSASADPKSYQHSSLFFEPLMRWLFPNVPPATVEELHHLFRKTCHLTEYAILGGLGLAGGAPTGENGRFARGDGTRQGWHWP